jgi:hypothetical protein
MVIHRPLWLVTVPCHLMHPQILGEGGRTHVMIDG